MLHTAERTTGHDSSENPIFQRHLIAYHTAAKMISGNVLEIGCGEGYGIPMLAPSCISYTAIDKFQTEVANLPANASFKQMSVPELKGFEDNSFDFVVSFQVIEHIEDDNRFMAEIKRVLKPGGKLIFTTPNKLMSLTRNPWHVREYTPTEMANLIKAHFGTMELNGVFGNEKVMDYYQKNKAGVQKFTRFDIFNLQYRLPRRLLQIPYDIANRMNRRMLSKQSTGLVNDIVWTDYFISPIQDSALDYFAICEK